MNDNLFLRNGDVWPDDRGVHINAHGGGILEYDCVYYWYGEHKIAGPSGNLAWVGVHVYRSTDLRCWQDAGIAFDIRDGLQPGLVPGCVIERPKVVRNRAGKFVMWFHLENDATYSDAMLGVAVADAPEGPFRLLRKCRPNPGVWPVNVPPELQDPAKIAAACRIDSRLPCNANADTPQVSILGMDLEAGQQSRDMTVFVDDDDKAYLVYSSEKNSTTHVAELDAERTGFTGCYCRIFPWRWMEAPVLFKRHGKYYFIGSDCTGWAPNAARSAVADSIFGPWRELGNPAVDPGKELTYGGQGTFALKLTGDRILFMADQWRKENPIDGRYLWLPIEWEGERPILRNPAGKHHKID